MLGVLYAARAMCWAPICMSFGIGFGALLMGDYDWSIACFMPCIVLTLIHGQLTAAIDKLRK